MGFVCIFLMTGNTQHLFLCLFAGHIFSLVKYLFKPLAYLFINWAVCLIIELEGLKICSAYRSVQLYDLQIFPSVP